MSALLDSLALGFDAVAPDLPGAPARRALLDATLAHGLPTARAERWRYTPLRALDARRFRLATDADGVAIDPALLDAIPAPRVVFVNGQFDAELSEVGELPPGVAFGVVTIEKAQHPAPHADRAFNQLNDVFAAEGALLGVEAGVVIEAPFHFVFCGAPVEGDIAIHALHVVQIGAGARACLVEHHLASGNHANLANHRVDVSLGVDAELIQVRVQDDAVGGMLLATTDAVVASRAVYRRVDLELGAGLSRHELDVDLAGEGARLHSGGVLAAAGRRHLDTRLAIVHAARDTTCDLVWRGAAAGRSRVSFHGGIRIDAGSDGAAAALSNKNLLLSDQAEIDTQPVLEIHADEVTASHGATVGRLDPMHLFYLRSRGIGEQQARAILTAAFGRIALAPLGDSPLVEPLAEQLRERLAALDPA